MFNRKTAIILSKNGIQIDENENEVILKLLCLVKKVTINEKRKKFYILNGISNHRSASINSVIAPL